MKNNKSEKKIKKSRLFAIMTAVLLMAALTAGVCFAADNNNDAKAKTDSDDKTVTKVYKSKKTETDTKNQLIVKGKYKDVTAQVVVKITDPEVMNVRDNDYIKYLSEAQLGDGLTVPMETKDDFLNMKMNAICEAMEQNKEAVQMKKAKLHDSNLMKRAEKEAQRKAKARYDAIWSQPHEDMALPKETDGRTKTYMDYKAVTDTSSVQYALLNNKKAETKDGFRMYDGYYCVALGSYYGTAIGTKFYITLSNGRTLRCILGDQKSDRHTDKNHMFAVNNKDIVEFIVDDIQLPGGDVSAVDGFEGSIVSIKRILKPEVIDFNGVVYVQQNKDAKDPKDKKNKKKKNKVNNHSTKHKTNNNSNEATKLDKNSQDNGENESTQTEVTKPEKTEPETPAEPEKPDPEPTEPEPDPPDKEGTGT